MFKFITALFLSAVSVFGAGIPYLTEPTNSRVDTYIPSATGPNQKWVPYLNVTNAITNIVIRPGPGATVATNINGVDYTIGTMWSTNTADGSITNINQGSGIVSVGGLTAAGHATLMSDNLATGGRLYNGKSNSVVVYAVDGSGDLVRIKNIPYVWPTSNAVLGQVLASTASGLLYWTNSTSSPFVAAGTNITLVTNGPVVTINSTSGSGGESLWTNDLDGPIRILRPIDQTRMVEVFHVGTNNIAVEGLIQNTNAAAFTQAGYFENLGTNSGIGSLSGINGGSIGLLGESAGALGAILTGDAIGVQGVADAGFKAQYGVQGISRAQFNAQTNVGGAFSANSNGKTGTTNVGIYVETQTAAGFNSNLVSSVAQLNSRDGSPLIAGQTNGTTSYLLRADGSQFIGKNVGQDANLNDFSSMSVPYVVSMTDSNEPAQISSTFAALDNENYGNFGINSWLADSSSKVASLYLEGGSTGVRHRFRFSAGASYANTFIDLVTNNTTQFSIDGLGDLTTIKSVPYSWPATNATAGKVLASDGGSPQQLYWTNQNSSGGGGSGVGPGTLNHLSMFNSTTTNVVDSNLIQEATNQWVYKQSSSTWTNGMSNLWYQSFTSASSNRGIELVMNGELAEFKQFRNGTAGSDVFAGMIFNDAWRINGSGTVAAGGHNGDLLPMAANALVIGSSSLPVKSITLSTGVGNGVAFANGGVIQSAGMYQSFNAADSTFHYITDNYDVFGIFGGAGVNGQMVSVANGIYAASSGTVTAAAADTFMTRGNEAHTWNFQTNNAGSATPPAAVLEGGKGVGVDHPGSDLVIAGARGTGLGRGGDLIGKTSPKGSTGSTLQTLQERFHVSAEPITLTTNSATTICTFTVPTSLTVVGGKFSATVEVKDASDIASVHEEFTFVALNKSATVTATNSTSSMSSFLATGSAGLSTVWTVTVSSQTVSIKCNATTTGINATTARVLGPRMELDSDSVAVVQFQ